MRLGVAWYAGEEWNRLREISVDAHELEETHAEWEAAATKALADMAAQGMVPERIDVAVDDLEAWWRAEGCAVDGSARAAFATELLRQKG
jgi:hypothetical protein